MVASFLSRGFKPSYVHSALRRCPVEGGIRTKWDEESLSEKQREINRVEQHSVRQSLSQSVARARCKQHQCYNEWEQRAVRKEQLLKSGCRFFCVFFLSSGTERRYRLALYIQDSLQSSHGISSWTNFTDVHVPPFNRWVFCTSERVIFGAVQKKTTVFQLSWTFGD